MTAFNSAKCLTITALLMLTLTACSKYEPVSVDQCSKVVSKARKVMGSSADSKSDMMKQCKAATDQERGWVPRRGRESWLGLMWEVEVLRRGALRSVA